MATTKFDLPELVFAADKKQIQSAVSAMLHHIAAKLSKDSSDVTENDIRNHGLIIIVDDGSEYMSHRPDKENDWKEYPHTVEPGDYYSDDSVRGTRFVKGPGLLRLMKRLNMLPMTRSFPDPKDINKMRGELVARAIQHHGWEHKPEILKQTAQFSLTGLSNQLDKYRKL